MVTLKENKIKLKQRIILILGARAPIALELARSFKKQGIKVIMADSMHLPITRWSNAIEKYEKVPSVRFETRKYIDRIRHLVRKNEVSDIIPCSEETFYVAKYKNQFDCKVWTTGIEILNSLHNKESFSEKFSTLLSIPETISLDKFKDWENSESYVFKQKYSRFAAEVISVGKVKPNQFPKKEKWIAQKKIHGTEICVFSIWNEGTLRNLVCYQPIYRAGKGAGIFFRQIENKEVEKQVKLLGEKLQYTGMLSFDIIIENNKPWFIECNPRGTSGAHLLKDSLAESFVGQQKQSKKKIQKHMLFFLLIFSFPTAILKKEVRQARDVIFEWNDPLPMLLQWLSILEITLIMVSKGLSLLKASTYDMEWNGDES